MSSLSKIAEYLPEYKSLFSAVEDVRLPAAVTGLSHIHKAHLIHSLCEKNHRRAVVIVPDESEAIKLAADLNAMRPGAYVYPARDFTLRSVEGQSREYEHQRLAVLKKMLDGDYTAVVFSTEAALQLTIPPEELMKRTMLLESGENTPIEHVIEALLAAGYVNSGQVDGPGQFARRGGILDFFPPNSELPLRVEFWGDTVDTISYFDTDSQRRTENVQKAEISPATEVVFDSPEQLADKLRALVKKLKGKPAVACASFTRDAEKLEQGVTLSALDRYLPLAYAPATVFDYGEDALLFASESLKIKERCRSFQTQMNEDIKILLEEGMLCTGLDRYSIDYTDVLSRFEGQGVICLENFPRAGYDFPLRELTSLTARQLSSWGGSLQLLEQDVRPALENNYTVCVMAGTEKAARTLTEDLKNEKVRAVFHGEMPEEFVKGHVNVIPGGLSAGLDYPSGRFMLVTHANASQKKTLRAKHKAGESIGSLEELQRGDYVVHSSHGIGVFEGIHKLDMQGIKKDYIKIRYAKDDILYVPVTQLDLVSKYIGQREDAGVRLNKLGGQEWQKAKTRVRKAVKDMAKELTKLYAERMNRKGHAFLPDTDLQYEFEEHFPYDETDDQLRSTQEIKHDMERSSPMDRLLCGDVGFGKTEVALRAAFKCISEGMQCVMLVPTTLLAMQHYQNIVKRMEGFPLHIEMLSRFKTPNQKEQILSGLAKGSVDMVVGTHILISKDIKFKNLGLLIVDEEQRFGVAQKEKLKELFPLVDVLTLSATPIPRTLNMAMSGIRDMSTLEEAPQDRHPVQTYVMEHDNGVLNDAMRRELRRGGQCYYLHNRVESIHSVANRIANDIPEASVGVAHGKMTEEELNEIWRRLLENEIDILVCTTIIETGVDVSNVNTLIIEDADRMGLAQLHQLRGRVGRSSRRASAYLTFRRGRELTEIATNRLAAIREFTEFGSGFKIAMRDLEIRGAGNILGSEQHGHMEAVGYDMYLKLLNQAVREEKGETAADAQAECLIDLQVQAYIPENYIPSIPQRLSIYRHIADIRSEEDAQDVTDELIDRFGDPPKCVLGLIEIALLRNTAAACGITEINQKGDSILMYITKVDMQKVSQLAQLMRGRIFLSAGDKPYLSVKLLKEQQPVDVLREVLKRM